MRPGDRVEVTREDGSIALIDFGQYGPPRGSAELDAAAGDAADAAANDACATSCGDDTIVDLAAGWGHACVVTVDVTRANHHGAGLVGQSIQFDLSPPARVVGRVHDPSGVQVGDRVLVQARLPRDLTGTTQPYAARRLVDRGPKPQHQSQSQTTQSDSSGGSDQSDS